MEVLNIDRCQNVEILVHDANADYLWNGGFLQMWVYIQFSCMFGGGVVTLRFSNFYLSVVRHHLHPNLPPICFLPMTIVPTAKKLPPLLCGSP